jgi:aspartate/methionine/tyrosine aminotransferase
MEAIESALTPKTRLIVLSNLHNPSGALLSADTLQQISEVAQRNGIHVLVDEVYLDMLFDPGVPFAFQLGQNLADQANPFVTTNSLTKAYGLSGLRCGWILASPELAFRMWRLNDLFGVNAAHTAELMAVAAFDRIDALRRHAEKLLGENRVILRQCLDAHPELECFWPPGGSVVFPRLPKGDPAAFFDLLRTKYETSVVPGEFFGLPEHFRIGIAGETAMVKAGLERLGAALDDFSGGG